VATPAQHRAPLHNMQQQGESVQDAADEGGCSAPADADDKVLRAGEGNPVCRLPGESRLLILGGGSCVRERETLYVVFQVRVGS
jgi:hypothetical protein